MKHLSSAALAAFVVAATACGGKSKPASTAVTTTSIPSRPRPAAATSPTAEPATATLTPTGTGSESAPSFAPIRFEFDSSTLSAEARDELEQVAAWMARSAARITIEGHADERGTTEYNLALGQQRAESIASFLAHLGVDGGRLKTITFGEERPAVAGVDEGAWAANRRGELHPGR